MPDSTAAPTGLLTRQNTEVPLMGVSVDAEVSSFCARVVVTQRYVNHESNPIEAVYVFPLDEGAAVCGFEAIIDGTLVVGEVKEREQAFNLYDRAIEQGHGAFLLDEERPDVFQASVGNLLPGKEVLVKLAYVTELSVEGRSLRFSIPTTVSPRYAPAQDRVGVGRADSEALNPPLAWQVPYGLNLSVRLTTTGAISRIESPSHPVAVTTNGNQATVTLATRETALDRDFVLIVDAAGLDAPQAWIERDDEGGQAIAVGFVPSFTAGRTASDVTFLVDRSGSMDGASIEEVRNALQLCLRSMTSGCTFNIVGFGSTYESLFPSTRPYDDASLREADAHVRGLQANLGGTEILPALEFVLGQRPRGESVRQVVVLTDGEVTNTDASIALARKHAAHTRVFTFGIGAGSSQHLVRGLARAGGGAAEFIFPGERIEPKVVRMFGRLLSPALTDVRVNWGAVDATQAPSIVPPVFEGGRLLLYAFVREIRKHVTPTTVELTATSPSGPVRFAVEVDPSRMAPGRLVATLAARARIRELEESPEWTAARGSRQRERKESGITKEIVALSIRYGLISRETSFVAVERRETPVQGDMQLRRVPIALTTGWGDLHRRGATAAYPALASRRMTLGAPSAPLANLHAGSIDLGQDEAPEFEGRAAMLADTSESDEPMFSRILPNWMRRRASHEGDASAARPVPPPPVGMHALITLQRADGTWDLTEDFASVIGHDLSDLESALAGATGQEDEKRKAWATALALAWLRIHAAGMKAQWYMLADKAQRWLAAVAAAPRDRAMVWSEAAERLLSDRVRAGRS
jgi:Ca-activated chloride channel family protein